MTPLDALDPALKLPRIWLLADWVARIVNADTVAAMLVGELVLELDASLVVAAVLAVESAVEFVPEVALDEFNKLDRSEAWVLLTLPIDITCFYRDRWNQVVGRELENFSDEPIIASHGEVVAEAPPSAEASPLAAFDQEISIYVLKTVIGAYQVGDEVALLVLVFNQRMREPRLRFPIQDWRCGLRYGPSSARNLIQGCSVIAMQKHRVGARHRESAEPTLTTGRRGQYEPQACRGVGQDQALSCAPNDSRSAAGIS